MVSIKEPIFNFYLKVRMVLISNHEQNAVVFRNSNNSVVGYLLDFKKEDIEKMRTENTTKVEIIKVMYKNIKILDKYKRNKSIIVKNYGLNKYNDCLESERILENIFGSDYLICASFLSDGLDVINKFNVKVIRTGRETLENEIEWKYRYRYNGRQYTVTDYLPHNVEGNKLAFLLLSDWYDFVVLNKKFKSLDILEMVKKNDRNFKRILGEDYKKLIYMSLLIEEMSNI